MRGQGMWSTTARDLHDVAACSYRRVQVPAHADDDVDDAADAWGRACACVCACMCLCVNIVCVRVNMYRW